MTTTPDMNEQLGSGRRRGVRHVLRRAETPAVISIGGGLGALARYAVSLFLPTVPDQFPLGTFLVNVVGCFLIGVLMVLVTDVWVAHRLVRPFLGIGVLGGFTTLSTYAVEGEHLLRHGSPWLAVAYLAGTAVCALLAVVLGVGLVRWATGTARGGTR